MKKQMRIRKFTSVGGINMLKEELWKYFKNTGSVETYLLYKTMEKYKIETSNELSRVLDVNRNKYKN